MNTAASFWARVDKSGACWVWTGAKTGHGYGVCSIEGRQQGTHRIAWKLTNGPIPPGLFVCHHCDNPPCCNPAHLFLGTAKDNIADMVKKGRDFSQAKGYYFQLFNLRELREANGITQKELANTMKGSIRWIAGIEQGTIGVSKRTAGKLAAALNVPPAALLTDPAAPNAAPE